MNALIITLTSWILEGLKMFRDCQTIREQSRNYHRFRRAMAQFLRPMLSSLFLVSFPLYASTVVFQANGKLASVELPKGYCDITQSSWGQHLKVFVEERVKSLPSNQRVPDIEVVFAPCSGYGPGYPWGYITTNKFDLTGTDQAMLNTYAKKNLGILTAKFNDEFSSSSSLETFERATGLKIEAQIFGTPTILVANANHYLVGRSVSSKSGNSRIEEIVLSSTMVRNGRSINMHGYVLQGERQLLFDLLKGIDHAAGTFLVR